MQPPFTWLLAAALTTPLLTPAAATSQGVVRTDEAALRRMGSALLKLGYSADNRTAQNFLRSVGSRGPTYIPGLGAEGSRLLVGKARACADSLRTAIPSCIRFDGIEAYAARPDSLKGLVPFTLAGTSGQPLQEVPASKEVLADAAAAASSLKVRLYRPPLLPPLPVTPDE